MYCVQESTKKKKYVLIGGELKMVEPKNMDVSQLLVMLLHCFGGTIPGKLYVEKLSFLSVNEIPELEVLKDRLEFKAHKLGMFSEKVIKAMDELKKSGLVISKTYSTDAHNKEIFTLTPEGKKKGREFFDQMDDNIKIELSHLCKGAKQLGYSGILRYTYDKYPEFTSKSEIVEEVFNSYDF